MQYDSAFSYQFEDQQWPIKLGLGALISLVPILNLALVGYMVGIIRNVAAHAPQPLPHWDDFGRKFTDGLIITLAGLIYAAPMLIALLVPIGMLVASGGRASNTRLEDLGNALGGAGWVLLAGGLILFILYALLLSIIRPVILVIFSRDGTFAACFKIGEIARIVHRHSAPFFRTWVAVVLAGMGVGLIGGLINLGIGWIPCIGWAVGFLLGLGSTIYLMTIDAHLFGQFRALALQAVPPGLPVEPEKTKQNPGDLSS